MLKDYENAEQTAVQLIMVAPSEYKDVYKRQRLFIPSSTEQADWIFNLLISSWKRK